MQNTFSSKLFIGNKKKNLALRILLFIIAVIIILCVLIKLIVGDFRFSDISVIVISVLVLLTCKSNSTPIPQYAPVIGKIDFSNEEMIITYADVNGGETLGKFTETAIIRYEDIESVQYSHQLQGYCIIAKCLHKRLFDELNQEKVLSNREAVVHTYMYVLDEDEDVDIRKNLQKFAQCIVANLDADVNEEED